MCGIAGILKSLNYVCPASVINRMRDEVEYRGPDDSGSVFLKQVSFNWAQIPASGEGWQVGLGHRRLSILDLTSAGHQPMAYRDKFWIIFNGEVYNFIELRADLEKRGHIFQSTSDTEVILAAFAEWGTSCFAKFRGMWGLVILDCSRNEVILSRDRLGIKPLYFWRGSGIVAIASEIKQFLHVPGFVPRLNAAAGVEYLRTGYEDTKQTFFDKVEPVQAGSWLKIALRELKVSEPQSYWEPEKVQVVVTDAEEAGKMFAEKLRESVTLHLRSDVPVGCALSGGLDSSAIAVLAGAMQNGQQNTIHTFTSTFPGHACDEREYSDAVLAAIHAEPHFVTPDPIEFQADLDRFLWVHDEPVGSFSMYAGYCVARLTRQYGVPVTLNGQGGDEIFSGYWQTYFLHLLNLWKRRQLLTLTKHFVGALFGNGNPTLISQVPVMFKVYQTRAKPPFQVCFDGLEVANDRLSLRKILNLGEQAQRLHEIREMFLPRLLKWEDRNSMAFSVEGRYPFLDHELIELCLSFSPSTLFKSGWTKLPLRLGLSGRLPPKVLNRRSKFGFETPHDQWLSGTLRPMLESWLKSDRPIWAHVKREEVQRLAERTGYYHKRSETGKALFRVFMFDRWLELFNIRM